MLDLSIQLIQFIQQCSSYNLISKPELLRSTTFIPFFPYEKIPTPWDSTGQDHVGDVAGASGLSTVELLDEARHCPERELQRQVTRLALRRWIVWRVSYG